ncbi:hypothetical protein C8R45DRAFT_1077602 [Mycena sanguinolenta]|nr:hypothetical protein C8R45DRAFT_1077602 [Mycena sanguinolenta]
MLFAASHVCEIRFRHWPSASSTVYISHCDLASTSNDGRTTPAAPLMRPDLRMQNEQYNTESNASICTRVETDISLFDPRAPLYRVDYPELNIIHHFIHSFTCLCPTPTRRLSSTNSSQRQNEDPEGEMKRRWPEHSSKLQQDDSESRCVMDNKVSETHTFVTFSSGRGIAQLANTIRLRHGAPDAFDASKVMVSRCLYRPVTTVPPRENLQLGRTQTCIYRICNHRKVFRYPTKDLLSGSVNQGTEFINSLLRDRTCQLLQPVVTGHVKYNIKSSSMMIDITPSDKGKSKFVFKVIYNKLPGTPVSIIANCNELIKEATTLGRAKFFLSNCKDEYFEVTDFIIAHEDSARSSFAPSPAFGIKVSEYGALSDGEKDEIVINEHVVSSVTWLLEHERETVGFQKYSGTLEHPRHTDKQGATINAFQHFMYLNSNKVFFPHLFNVGLSGILIFE